MVGKLQNIGFKESEKYGQFDCYVFHDVDLIPEDSRNFYDCSTSPRHLAPSLDKFGNHVYSPDTFGGAVAFLKEDFKAVNGYSNSYYGVQGKKKAKKCSVFRLTTSLTIIFKIAEKLIKITPIFTLQHDRQKVS